MIKKSTIFDYLTQIVVIWGIAILSLCLFCRLFGEIAIGYSSIFQLGSVGLSITTIMQFLLLSIIIVTLRWVFFTDILIKKLGIVFRCIMMFICIILSVGFFAAVFGWFPINQVKPWFMFFVCFFICSFVSVFVSVLKEKSDNRKMQAALERLKGEE